MCNLVIKLFSIMWDRTYASFDPCLLCVPPISKMCANSFFDRSFTLLRHCEMPLYIYIYIGINYYRKFSKNVYHTCATFTTCHSQ